MAPDGMTSYVRVFDGREGSSFRISLTYDTLARTGKTTANTDTYHCSLAKLADRHENICSLRLSHAVY
jgi:hypothetical protein